MFTHCPSGWSLVSTLSCTVCFYSSVFAFQSLSPFKLHLWNFLFLSSLPAPDHSRSEMDLSAPGSEHSDDALSLRSRSVPGFNETVSSVSFFLLQLDPHALITYLISVKFTHCLLFFLSYTSTVLYVHIKLRICGLMNSTWCVRLNVNFTSELTSKSI